MKKNIFIGLVMALFFVSTVGAENYNATRNVKEKIGEKKICELKSKQMPAWKVKVSPQSYGYGDLIICSEISCSAVDVYIEGEYVGTVDCDEILYFEGVDPGEYLVEAEGCGIVWSDYASVDDGYITTHAFCAGNGLDQCPVGCAEDGSYICDSTDGCYLLYLTQDLNLHKKAREFRDQLRKNFAGEIAVKAYYRFSPNMIWLAEKIPFLKKLSLMSAEKILK